nr:RecName: Full=Putative uncharacterized protein C17A2.15 [Schizosaccharomyces pombe 972h-]
MKRALLFYLWNQRDLRILPIVVSFLINYTCDNKFYSSPSTFALLSSYLIEKRLNFLHAFLPHCRSFARF